jgi:GT2 family glycosyltransferase
MQLVDLKVEDSRSLNDLNHHEQRHIVGHIESINSAGIIGWVLNPLNLKESVEVELLVDEQVELLIRPNMFVPEIAEFLDRSESDLGLLGFEVPVPYRLKKNGSHSLQLRCALSRQPIGKRRSYTYKQMHLNFDYQVAEISNPEPVQFNAPNNVLLKSVKPIVSAVILNRNGEDCLEALFESWHLYNTVPAELIVIDHDSIDQSKTVAAKWSYKIPINWIQLDTNQSFSESSNLGARHAKGKYILFLNNDIVLVQDVLPELIKTLEDKDTALVGLKLIKHDPEKSNLAEIALSPIQHLGVRFTLSGHVYWPYEVNVQSPGATHLFSACEVPAVTAAIMLARKNEFLEDGGFDTGYFYGYEDVEYCLRKTYGPNRKRIVCRNDLVALHRHGHSRYKTQSAKSVEHQIANQRRLVSQKGIWIKSQWWRSLIAKDKQLCSEQLCIGLVVDDTENSFTGNLWTDLKQGFQGIRQKSSSANMALALEWAKEVKELFPESEIKIILKSEGWSDLSGFHSLLILTPDFASNKASKLRTEYYLRADCRVFAIIPELNSRQKDKAVALWADAELSSFCAALHSPTQLHEWLGHKIRLCIVLHSDPNKKSAAKVENRKLVRHAGESLAAQAMQLGMIVTTEELFPGEKFSQPVCEICVHIWPALGEGAKRQISDLEDALYIGYAVGPRPLLSNEVTQGFERVWTEKTSIKTALTSALKTVEARIGHSVRAS